MIRTRYPSILPLNIAGLALFLSWCVPAGHGFWSSLDTGVFRLSNHKLIENPPFLRTVVITNNRAFDGYPLLAMGAPTLHSQFRETSEGRRRIVAIGLVTPLIAVALDQLGQVLIPVRRTSPMPMLDNIYRVSELLHIPTKDASKGGFPGDHGVMLLIFFTFMLRYFGKVVGIIGLIIAMVFTFPCVVIGAHWLADIVVGSMTAVLAGLP